MKKLLIMLVSLISVLSVGYAFNNRTEMKAAGNYQSGGGVTGRINKAPSGITNTTTGIKKGDKVLMGTKNPNNTANPLTWILLKNETYSDHSCTTPGSVCTGKDAVTAWLSMTTESVKKINLILSDNDYADCDYYDNGTKYNASAGEYYKSNIYQNVMTNLNKSVTAQDKKIIAPRNLTRYHAEYKGNTCYNGDGLALRVKAFALEVFKSTNEIGKNLFLPDCNHWYDAEGMARGDLYPRDAAFTEKYWTSTIVHYDEVKSPGGMVRTPFVMGSDGWLWGDSNGSSNQAPYNDIINKPYPYAVRPAAYLDMSNVVFAVSKGSNTTSLGEVTIPANLSSNYTNILNETKNSRPMKLRLENTTLTDFTSLNGLKNKSGAGITKASKNTTIYLDADALAGNDGNGGTYTVSAIVFNSEGQFEYYKPLEDAKGGGSYEFDLTGIPVGDYEIGIVNEAYSDSSTAPADSSAITATLPLTIVNPLTITATASTGLEYGKNVNQNDTVATYSTSNGADPITTTLESDTSVSGHSNDYQLFSLNICRHKLERKMQDEKEIVYCSLYHDRYSFYRIYIL